MFVEAAANVAQHAAGHLGVKIVAGPGRTEGHHEQTQAERRNHPEQGAGVPVGQRVVDQFPESHRDHGVEAHLKHRDEQDQCALPPVGAQVWVQRTQETRRAHSGFWRFTHVQRFSETILSSPAA